MVRCTTSHPNSPPGWGVVLHAMRMLLLILADGRDIYDECVNALLPAVEL